MFAIDNKDILKQHSLFMQELAKGTKSALMQKDFFMQIFPKLSKKTEFAYPYTVGIPKSIQHLLEKDFEPEYTITVNEPIKGIYTDNWFANSTKGVYLHGCGYVNGDNRYLAQQKLDDKDIHMVLAGATGQGKSVTLNSIILTLCSEYAPWDVNLTMCDAKVVEFKTYATKFPMPHIRSIAATGDADYLISVLAELSEEMTKMNSVYTQAGVKNIEDFRKRFTKRNAEGKIIYYLAMPQNIIVIDEFQTMFKMAQKRTKEIVDIIDSFARLGRNTGYHLLMASQELGTDMPKGVLSNIKVRAAMGCFPNVSTMILGNDGAAANYGKKGALIINNDPAGADGNNKDKNVNYRVPFAPDSELAEIGQSIIKNGKELGFKSHLSFYDELSYIYEKDYKKYLKSFRRDPNRFLLGEPSFMMPDNEQIVKLNFNGMDIENICVYSGININLRRYYFMLKTNVELIQEYNQVKFGKPNVQNVVICGDPMFDVECHAKDLATPNLYFDNKSYEGNLGFSVAKSMISQRKLMLEVDKKCLENQKTSEISNDLFDSLNLDKEFDTPLNRARCYYIRGLLMTDEAFRKEFSLGNTRNTTGSTNGIPEDKLKTILNNLFAKYKGYNLINKPASYKDFPKMFVWVLGLNKIQGLGRDNKPKYVEELNKYLVDGSAVNVRYLIFTTTVEDMKGVVEGCGWFICEGLTSLQISKIKASDFYPTQIGGGLGVLFYPVGQTSAEKCRKFKKVILNGEIPPTS